MTQPPALPLPAKWATIAAYRRIFPSTDVDDGTVIEAYSYESGRRSTEIVAVLWVARMIEKYEPHLAPVDPDVLAVREILAAYYCAKTDHISADWANDGSLDMNASFVAALAAYRSTKNG